MHPFDSAYRKLDRARHHARDLRASITKAFDPETFNFVGYPDGAPCKRVYRVHGLPAVDPDWSLILGDFIANTRNALDHLAWSLADPAVRNHKTKFPILSQDTDKQGNPKPATIHGVTDPAVLAAVDAVQPYQELRFGHDVEDDLLYGLNRLCNTDKHQLLLVVTAAMRTDSIWWGSDEGDPEVVDLRVEAGPLSYDQQDVMWLTFDREPYASFDPHLTLEVRLGGGNWWYHLTELTSVVDAIYSEVEHGVIGQHFAPLFGMTSRHGLWAFDRI